jgi:hypothetical protein
MGSKILSERLLGEGPSAEGRSWQGGAAISDMPGAFRSRGTGLRSNQWVEDGGCVATFLRIRSSARTPQQESFT